MGGGGRERERERERDPPQVYTHVPMTDAEQAAMPVVAGLFTMLCPTDPSHHTPGGGGRGGGGERGRGGERGGGGGGGERGGGSMLGPLPLLSPSSLAYKREVIDPHTQLWNEWMVNPPTEEGAPPPGAEG